MIPWFRIHSAQIAWGVLGVELFGYEWLAPSGQLMSEGVDRALACHPWVTRLVFVYLAAHVLNAVPRRLDPLAYLSDVDRRFRGAAGRTGAARVEAGATTPGAPV